MGEKERILDHLENDYSEPIRDPVWKHIYISRELFKIIELEPFQKLGRIKQLGPAYLVYPGATHTRLSHSLGVFHLARRMIASLVRRNPRREDSRMARAAGSGVEITLEGVKAFLCAALLHDVGHYPFAHSLKDLHVEAHEALTAKQILGDFERSIRGSLRIEAEAVAAIINPKSAYRGGENVSFYWKILSGVLDPDKLDYLNRDAYFCGVPYGIQDVDFILEEAYPHRETGVAISPKGITALEDVLFAKYLMYKTVYWHKTVRIATAMIKKAVGMGLVAGAIRREDLYGLDDEEFFAGFNEKRFPGFRLITDVRKRILYKQVFKVPFRSDSKTHRELEDVETRLRLEERIAREAGDALGRVVPPESVIIDVPERVSFDIEIPVLEEGSSAPLSSSHLETAHLFSGRGTEDLPGSLRCISVNCGRDEDLLTVMGRIDLSRHLAPS
jgi:HD superfamily phosphohydrolase